MLYEVQLPKAWLQHNVGKQISSCIVIARGEYRSRILWRLDNFLLVTFSYFQTEIFISYQHLQLIVRIFAKSHTKQIFLQSQKLSVSEADKAVPHRVFPYYLTFFHPDEQGWHNHPYTALHSEK